MELLILLFIGVLVMPFYGGYLSLAGTKEQRPLGVVVCIVGILVWIALGVL